MKIAGIIGGIGPESTIAYLLGEVEKLARAGADFGALAANTPHIVFEPLRRRSPIPLVSIVEATCRSDRHRPRARR